jgi:hypothetical protein
MGKKIAITRKEKRPGRKFRFTWEPDSYEDVKWDPDTGTYSLELPIYSIDGSYEITDDTPTEEIAVWLANKIHETGLGAFLLDMWDVPLAAKHLEMEELE